MFKRILGVSVITTAVPIQRVFSSEESKSATPNIFDVRVNLYKLLISIEHL